MSISVEEAGRMGGQATSRLHKKDGFYERIGRRGGARVKELVAAGKATETNWKEKYLQGTFFTQQEADELISIIRSRTRGEKE